MGESTKVNMNRRALAHERAATTSMSDKLPIELWRLIFWHATASNAEFAVFGPPFGGIQYALQYDFDDKKTLKHKVLLSLICKAWRTIALEFLFEYLLIDLSKLERKIQLYDAIDSYLNLSYALRHVRHIRGRRSDPFITRNCELQLARLLHLCSNLKTYEDNLHTYSTSILPYVTTGLHTLRHLVIESEDVATRFLPLLSKTTPKLEYLVLAELNAPIPRQTIHLPALRSLDWSIDGAKCQWDPETVWDVPNIHTLSFRHRRADGGMAVLAKFPRDLHVLAVSRCYAASVLDILALFPKLHTFTAGFSQKTRWRPRDTTFPSLQHVAMRSTKNKQYSVREVRRYTQEAFELLTDRKMFPALGCISLRHAARLLDIEDTVWWDPWLTKLRSLNIRLQDDRHRLIF